MKTPLFYLEIDVSDHTTDTYCRWANYGAIVAQGEGLDELLDDATVDIMDQDGGELDTVPADSNWMQDLIEDEYKALSCQ